MVWGRADGDCPSPCVHYHLWSAGPTTSDSSDPSRKKCDAPLASCTTSAPLPATQARYLPLGRYPMRRFIPIVLEEGEGDALHGTRTYNAITWWKPRIVAHLVAQGFVTHMSGGRG